LTMFYYTKKKLDTDNEIMRTGNDSRI